ncbi:MAG: hypothetical protein AB7G23_11460 [Vicinamibacterales bacterium]
MELNRIEATLNQLAAQMPKSAATSGAPANFDALIESLRTDITAAIKDAVAGAGLAPAAPGSAAALPPAVAPAPTALRTTHQLPTAQQALLRQPGGPMYEQLPEGSPMHNEREALMREALDLEGLERQLQDLARDWSVEYDRSDLDGILRNAGYDAAHLGSTERYMDAVQHFIGEAENNYRQRSSNTPGSDA